MTSALTTAWRSRPFEKRISRLVARRLQLAGVLALTGATIGCGVSEVGSIPEGTAGRTGGNGASGVGGTGGSTGGATGSGGTTGSGGSTGGSTGTGGAMGTGGATGSGGATTGTGGAGTGGATTGTGATGGGAGSGAGGSAGTGTSGAAGSSGARDGGAGTGGSSGSGGGGLSDAGGTPPVIPPPKDTCPTLANGNMTFRGRQVMIWVGTKQATPAPIIAYWHGTGSSPMEVTVGLGQATISAITGMGGLVVAPSASDGMGGKDGSGTTGNYVWYVGDFNTIDEVVACAVQQLNIDTRHIHAAGMSAGGLQTAAMAYARSSYMAGVVPYSGGRITGLHPMMQDPSNVPAVMAVHGKMGSDVVGIDFATASATLTADIKSKGGFALTCDHGGGHTIPANIGPSAWQFMKDHPYRTKAPFPYAGGIPAALPAYCKIP
jgi:hypothetical protein